jgi:3-deoxy-manno-octulosonate cytidylyltransferase (CMP-KDO synthetase)
VTVATDDLRIARVAANAGATVAMTRSDHVCGTDRIAEVVRRSPGKPSDVILNVQGDEPCIEPEAMRAVISLCAREAVDMATAITRLPLEDESSPHVVKVVIDADGRARYFSRQLIPWSDAAAAPQRWRHLGLYAYRRHILLRLASLPEVATEQAERLEQLRALAFGIDIHTVYVDRAWRGVDTPADLATLEATFDSR